MEKNFDISIVIAVYNMQEYLEEAIQSIESQTIGFEKIQVILVNDGSLDSSLDICRKYEKKYPANIIVVNKENGGVASARNEGMMKATGKYINFLDADDMLEKDVCQKVVSFFDQHDVDVVSIPLKYFEGKTDDHALNWKFEKTRVIDIDDEIDAVQLSISSSFVKREVVQKFLFNPELKYGEDAEVVNKCILQKRRYGVLSDVSYMYRYRNSDGSAIQRATNSYEYYLPVIEKLYWSLIQYEKKLTGEENISKYLENLILYEMKWKVRKNPEMNQILGTYTKEYLFEKLREVLLQINDSSIICLNRCNIFSKLFMLSIKYQLPIKEMEKQFKIVSGETKQFVVWRDFILAAVSSIKVFISIFDMKDGNLAIEGMIGGAVPQELINLAVVVEHEGERKEYPVIRKENEWVKDTIALHEKIKDRFYFKAADIPLQSGMKLSFQLILKGKRTEMKIATDALSGMQNYLDNSYIVKKGYIISKNNNCFLFEKLEINRLLEQENSYLSEVKQIEKLTEEDYKYIKRIRQNCINEYKQSMNKTIWIFMDRVDSADDNAEHLFKYAMQQDDNIEKYFVVSKSSRDFEKMKQFGNVLEYGSPEHCVKMMQADKIISSQASMNNYTPFSNELTPYFSGFLTADRVFLQHGVTKDDLSLWLNHLNKNLKLFVCASPYEYDSILNGKYGYDNSVVKELGFPRFDALRDKREKAVVYMPTWNSELSKTENGEVVYNPEFKNSSLFREIRDVLHSDRLKTLLKKYDYKLRFKPHPNLMPQLGDFGNIDDVDIITSEETYQDIFRTAGVMITDYSSVFFDFSYLKKPLVYYQVRKNHLDKGYFDYHTMGFGEVAESMDQLTTALENIFKNQGQMETKYQDRVNAFFSYTDKNNCKRVYDAIKEI